MHVRSAADAGLDRFVGAGGDPAHQEEVRRYLDTMFAAGSMRPGWCFVAEEGTTVGRIAFWTLPGMEEPFALVLFDVDRRGDLRAFGAGLLEYALKEARRMETREIEHVIDVPPQPPQFQHHAEARIGLLAGAGFAPRRETVRFEWTGGSPPIRADRLRYRTLPEVGEEAFVAAISRVSEGTLDQEIQSDRDELGPEGAARDFFEDAARVEHDPSWWRLAYAGEDLVGLVMPELVNPIFPAFAQARQVNGDQVQAIQQVFAKLSVSDQFGQIDVGQNVAVEHDGRACRGDPHARQREQAGDEI